MRCVHFLYDILFQKCCANVLYLHPAENHKHLHKIKVRYAKLKHVGTSPPTCIFMHAHVQTLFSLRSPFIHFLSRDQWPYYTIAANDFILKQFTHLHVR
jgi:hypothetical protein